MKKLHKLVLPPPLQKKVLFSNILFYLFVIFSVTAIINPKWGTTYSVLESRQGLDIVFAIDVSRSMDIVDVQTGGNRTSRLKRGLHIAKEAAKAVPACRFASAIGRGQGYLAIPLTFDNETVFHFFDTLNSQAMTGRSSNLQSLIDAAAEAFQTTSGSRRIIVLISDGEAHFGNLRDALNRCVRDGIVIIAVGIGSDDGAPVPGITEEPIPVSRRDAAALRIAAERTGGVYIDGNREDGISNLRSQLVSMTQDLPRLSIDGESNRKTEPKQQRYFFTVLAIIAYGASKFILRTVSKKRIERTVLITSLVLLLSSCSKEKLLLVEANYLYSRGRYDEAAVPYFKALENEETAPYAEYGLGLTYHSMDESATALSRYSGSYKRLTGTSDTEHRELRYRILYNTGIIFFEEGDYNAAAASFREALKIDPSKIDAKRNLEISLMSVTRESSRERQPETHNEMKEIIFDYVREQEQPYWRSGEWQAEEKFTGPDY